MFLIYNIMASFSVFLLMWSIVKLEYYDPQKLEDHYKMSCLCIRVFAALLVSLRQSALHKTWKAYLVQMVPTECVGFIASAIKMTSRVCDSEDLFRLFN